MCPKEDFFGKPRTYGWTPEPHKLLAAPGEAPLLFDLTEDPHEEVDLAAEHPEIVERLEARHAVWAKEMIDPLWKSSATDPKD